ncbi:hypothetical protein ANCDUO_14822 [Ancylostoma duodenale]|uniref:Peptidase M20 dimerisation domain-containing protein n=1 Tax=Ancylostoma duodenale TaxID=51022 RepID=A0A0C2CFC1_9BILA|nr:hypothetical protein ANCDUO_14822 [Ancylostoma duodenale]
MKSPQDQKNYAGEVLVTYRPSKNPMEDIAVTKFREYLRVNTEQPKPDYAACKTFLFKLADELAIHRYAVETVPGKPFIIMTIPGFRPELESLMLYSHTDVVPTFKYFLEAQSWKNLAL